MRSRVRRPPRLSWAGTCSIRNRSVFGSARARSGASCRASSWSLWHLPLFLTAGTFQADIPNAGFVLATVSTSVIIGWLFNNSGGSVVLPAIYHALPTAPSPTSA